LRQLGRHLTAYDLVTFHHRGANYPDALLLDAALKNYLSLSERQPDLLMGDSRVSTLRRRALRQACLLRHVYEGHAVPDAPTSPGENARVLPPPHARVPEEQILQPTTRRRRLYADDPLSAHLGPQGRQLLQQSLADFDGPDEVRELGMALFIDRPLGVGKLPGEPDQTPLLAHEAFSRSLAISRLHDVARFARALKLELDTERYIDELRRLGVAGVPASAACAPARGIVSLADARRVADDFVLVRTLPGSMRDFFAIFPVADAARRYGIDVARAAVVIIRVASPTSDGRIAIFDKLGRERLELAVDVSGGFQSRGGGEYPAAGLRLVRVWQESGDQLRELSVSETIRPSSEPSRGSA